MKRITFWSIFLLGLMTAAHCKKYLVEVADKHLDDSKDEVDVEAEKTIRDSKYF